MKVIGIILGFFCGVFFGLLFYEIVLIELEFSPKVTVTLGVVVCTVLGFGNAFSKQVQCITLLTIPGFCGKGGRGAIKTLVLAYLIAGPIHNMMVNCGEVLRSFLCTGNLAHNLSKARYDLTFKPYYDALSNMKLDMRPIKDAIKTVKDVVDPIKGEILDDEEIEEIKEENDYIEGPRLSEEIDAKYNSSLHFTGSKEIEQKYYRKLEYRCQNLISKSEANCIHVFGKARLSCEEKLPSSIHSIVCAPLKLTFVCNIFSALGGEKVCNPRDKIARGFGNGFLTLNKSANVFKNQFTNVHIEFKFTNRKDKINSNGIHEYGEDLLQRFQEKKSVFDIVMKYAKRILALSFVRFIAAAQEYHDNYLIDISYDNKYITPYFKNIDKRRKINGKYHLLPLKRMEMNKLISPYSIHLSGNEKIYMVRHIIQLAVEMSFAATFMTLDYILYRALEIVHSNSLIEYVQEGEHEMEIKIKGTGVIARFLRSLLTGFNYKKKVKAFYTNKECLPIGHPLGKYYLYKILGMYGLLLFLTIFQSYTNRLFRVVCLFFYRKHEKRRILHLYNQILRERLEFFSLAKKNVKKLAKENKLYVKGSLLYTFCQLFPKCLGFLRLLPGARQSCILCRSREPFLGYPKTCPNRKCPLPYCPTCWKDIGERCFVCEIPDTDELDEDTESSFGISSEDTD